MKEIIKMFSHFYQKDRDEISSRNKKRKKDV